MKLGKSFVIVTLFSSLLLGGCNKSSSTGYKKYVDALTSALGAAKDYRGPMTVTGAMRDQAGDFVESGTNVDTVDPDTNRWCQTLSGLNYDLMEPAEEEYLGHLYNFNGESYKVRDVSTRTYTEKNSYCQILHYSHLQTLYDVCEAIFRSFFRNVFYHVQERLCRICPGTEL